MNKVTIIGRFVADPELKTTNSGKSVTSFTLAVDRPYIKGADRKADFLDVVAWKSTAEFICKYFSKGDPIDIEGSIQTRNWEDKHGQKRKETEIVAENVEFLPTGKLKAVQEEAPAQQEEFTPVVVDDEDLPF